MYDKFYKYIKEMKRNKSETLHGVWGKGRGIEACEWIHEFLNLLRGVLLVFLTTVIVIVPETYECRHFGNM